MRKLILFLCLLGTAPIIFAQRIFQCDICQGATCNQTFNLSQGNTYTFSTSTYAGAVYTWSVSGGLAIIGARDQATVQVQATSCGTGRICLAKSADGKDVCCICYDVVVTGCECPALSTFGLTNNVNSDPYWCDDAAANYLWFSWVSTIGTATVTIMDLSQNPLQTYYGASGAPMVWPNGIYINNQNPPPQGTYLLKIQNDCNPQDVLGGFIEVNDCIFSRDSAGHELSNIGMEVYPNPVTGKSLTVKLKNVPAEARKANSKMVFTLVNSTLNTNAGTWTFDQFADQVTINTGTVAKGIYFLITNIGGKYLLQKVSIQ